MRNAALSLILLQMLLFVTGCGGESHSGDPYLGNLGDHSYANRRGKSYELAGGGSLSFSSFAGEFVWVDFAAPWCPPCIPQAQVIRQLEHATPGVAFITLMTSDEEPLSVATDRTASRWASRFGLDSSRVAACTETRVIPTHMLFSPEGQLLYWSEGGLSAAQIQSVLSSQMPKWNQQADSFAR
jgi:thiol-disulfide isomerase/thioredoxin